MDPYFSLKHKLLQYKYLLLAVVSIAAGVWFISGVPPLWTRNEILRDVGIGLLVAGIVGLSVDYFTRKDFDELLSGTVKRGVESSTIPDSLKAILKLLRLADDATSLGVRRVHRNRSGIDFVKLLSEVGPSSELRILGIALMDMVPATVHQGIRDALQKGSKVRMLMLDSKSKFVANRAGEEARACEDLRSDIDGTFHLHSNFVREAQKKGLGGMIELRCYDAPPQYLVFSTDSSMVVGFYLRGRRGEFDPHIEFDARVGGGLHEVFVRHFDSLWEASASGTASMAAAS